MVQRTSAPMYKERMGMSSGSRHSRWLCSRMATKTTWWVAKQERSEGRGNGGQVVFSVEMPTIFILGS